MAQVLVRWSNTPSTDSTSEEWGILKAKFSMFDPWGQGNFDGRKNVADKETPVGVNSENQTSVPKPLKFRVKLGKTNRKLAIATGEELQNTV